MAMGDSKTAAWNWQKTLMERLSVTTGQPWSYTNAGVGGATVATYAAAVGAYLAAMPDTQDPVVEVLCNWGANDVGALPAEATWKANYLTILDAIHAKWPQARAWVTKPWRRGFDALCNTLAAWIDDIVAARPAFANVADDERVWFENGDNGATYSTDGVHYNDLAIYGAKPTASLTAMGY